MNAAQQPTYVDLPSRSAIAATHRLPPSDAAAAEPLVHPRRSTHKKFSTVAVRQSAVLESSVKLTVNLLLAVVAGTTLAKLLPYYQTQRSELQSLQEAVQTAEHSRVSLWDEFSRNFDPQQAPSVMQEHSGKSLATRRAVVLVDPLQD
ncbi:MAG: hypothetical protein AAF921_25865 [Cyanobacteria bacterium P01_D01_bin.44]